MRRGHDEGTDVTPGISLHCTPVCTCPAAYLAGPTGVSCDDAGIAAMHLGDR